MTRRRTTHRVLGSLWFIPVLCVLGGLVLSFASIAVDRLTDYSLVPDWLVGDPDAALAVLSTIAASMVSLAALVLTITMVVVQLAMGQFSPRIVQTFLRDKPSQLAVGLFIATFAHSMLSLREVGSGEPPTVPGVAIVVAYVLVLLSIVVLVLYVHHIGQALRVSALIELVGDSTRRLIDENYEGDGATPARRGEVVATRSGVIRSIDCDRIVDLARRRGCQAEMLVAIGEFVPAGAGLLLADTELSDEDGREIERSVEVGLERTLEHDVGYGFRMLVDMAERSIAESAFLDPTTAVQSLDRLHECLRHLCDRRFPDGRHCDEDGIVRLRTKELDWDALVVLAFEEIRLAGVRSPQVVRRLTAALTDLTEVAPPERRAPVERQLELVRRSTQALRDDGIDIELFSTADASGLGVAASGSGTAGHSDKGNHRRSHLGHGPTSDG